MEHKVRQLIKNNNIEFVRMESVDINGVSRSLLSDADFFLSNIMGKGFPYCSTSIGGFQVNGDIVENTGLLFEIDCQNGTLIPDLQSFTPLPWLDSTSTVFCDFTLEDREDLSEICCRSACKKQLKKLENMGFSLYSAFEYEFYVADKETLIPVYDDINLSATANNNKTMPLVQDIMRNLKKIGIRPEVFHAEFGPAQHEISIFPAHGIVGVDNAYQFKSTVKDTCNKHDFTALFLSKPYPDVSGSSSHFNHSLWDLKRNVNVFSDMDEPDKLSKLCKNWLAGLQEHSKALTALQCHTLNCFERCKPNTFSPTNNSWGFDNRTVAYRVKNQTPSGTYIENRIPGGSANPYLVTIGSLIAGMDGIKRNLQLKSAPYQGNLYEAQELPKGVEKIPGSLKESLKFLKEDKVFVEELGENFLKAFCALKEDEIEKGSTIEETEKWEWYRRFYGQYL